MSSKLQKSNTRIMQQKAEKAKRLIEEVKTSIEIRGKSHQLWDDASAYVELTLINLDYVRESLEAVVRFNAEAEARKI